MQTKQVLETIRQIERKLAPIYNLLTEFEPFVYGDPRGLMDADNTIGRRLIVVSYQLGEFIETAQKDDASTQVLTAFGLSALLKQDYWIQVASIATKTPDRPDGARENWIKFYTSVHREIIEPARLMFGCVKPFTGLTIPPQLLEQQLLREEILAVNLSDRETLDLKTVAKVLSELEVLYDTINRIFQRVDSPPLQVLKIESGSNLRIDLRGLGETIKELKNAILEIWTKHRHKKADEIIDQHRVVASGIEVLGKIEGRVKKKELTDEDGTRFKRAIIQSTLGLFKNGALIDEIPPTETVDNVKLLDGFAYKLLSAPEEKPVSAAPTEAIRLDRDDSALRPVPPRAVVLVPTEPSPAERKSQPQKREPRKSRAKATKRK